MSRAGAFDRFVMVDWSAGAKPSPVAPSANAIWIADGTDVAYHRTRQSALTSLFAIARNATDLGQRLLIGVDFALGYPQGFARSLTGQPAARAVWDWLERHIHDAADNANTRFEVADQINARFPGLGPFWGRPKARDDLHNLPWGTNGWGGHGLARQRLVEQAVPQASTVWQLLGNGAVGGQALLGQVALGQLCRAFDTAVWPFDTDLQAPIVIAEIYPSLIDPVVRQAGGIKDAQQVRLMAAALAQMQARGDLDAVFGDVPPQAREEGWILGAHAVEALQSAARAAAFPDLVPPRLKNDCFALPAGVDWEPVDSALQRLAQVIHPVVGQQTVPLAQAEGRILAGAVTALRANPPAANTAVDGYGFAHRAASGAGRQVLTLVDAVAAAGAPFARAVPPGHAVRILTGAPLPKGVDTVVLQEDTTVAQGQVVFDGPVRAGANTRKAGEDVAQGATVLRGGQTLRAPDLALLAAVGVSDVPVFQRLKVAVLSTGDELRAPGQATAPHHTHDANRPMLLSLVRRWGFAAVDLGCVADDRDAVRRAFDTASDTADVLLTSGGASAGDEDHVSALLRAEGNLTAWRIALKPGRPLALAQWRGMPVFGLPGNPVAALVCALIFAHPACAKLGGGVWRAPQGFMVPAAFGKRKKPGRREYLRARMVDDGVQVFASEGSGRISGLSWADGLVELPDGAADITPGDLVRYIPFGSFGL